MELEALRRQMDSIDEELVRLFKQRMWVSGQIAQYKKAHALPVYVPEREREKLLTLQARVMPKMQPYLAALYEKIFALSRQFQEEQL